jgi:hypothetical protein
MVNDPLRSPTAPFRAIPVLARPKSEAGDVPGL